MDQYHRPIDPCPPFRCNRLVNGHRRGAEGASSPDGALARKRIIPYPLVVAWLAVCSMVGPASVAAQPLRGSGRLEGVVVRQDGSAVGGVVVLVEELRLRELTDATGKYAFDATAPGTYTVLSTLGAQSLRRPGVVITARATMTLRTVVDWPLSIFESVVVNGTTRLPARLVEAPAAVTVVGSDELATHALHGQLPRLLASTPGVDFVPVSIGTS